MIQYHTNGTRRSIAKSVFSVLLRPPTEMHHTQQFTLYNARVFNSMCIWRHSQECLNFKFNILIINTFKSLKPGYRAQKVFKKVDNWETHFYPVPHPPSCRILLFLIKFKWSFFFFFYTKISNTVLCLWFVCLFHLRQLWICPVLREHSHSLLHLHLSHYETTLP